MDAANQSLAEALRGSFSILKGIMLVIVVLFLFSNVRRIDSHEQALTLRLGRLQPQVRDPGLVWAMPFPIDEIVPLPTKSSNTFTIESHTFHREPNERDKPLSFFSWPVSRGLHPTQDGALMTADGGLVHVKWKITYKIDKVDQYVSNILSSNITNQATKAAEDLIRTFVETVGIHVASGLTAEEMIRTRVDDVQNMIRNLVNQRLTAIDSGIDVIRVSMDEPTPPIAVREAFVATQRMENLKEKQIQDANQEKTKILNEAAGEAAERLLAVLQDIDRREPGDEIRQHMEKDVGKILTTQAEGKAGQMIQNSGAYLATVVGQMRSDLELYRTLVPEYERNPHLLVNRLWEETKQVVFTNPGVTKVYRPPNSQIRLRIPLDPEATRKDEARRLQKTEFDPRSLMPSQAVPVGPEVE